MAHAVGLVLFLAAMANAVVRRRVDALWLGAMTAAVAAAGVAAVARIDGPALPLPHAVDGASSAILAWTTVGLGLLPVLEALGPSVGGAALRPACCGRSARGHGGRRRPGHRRRHGPADPPIDRCDRRARPARGGGPRGPRPARAAHRRGPAGRPGRLRRDHPARRAGRHVLARHRGGAGARPRRGGRPGSTSGASRSAPATPTGRTRPATSSRSPTPTGRRRRPSRGSRCSPSRASSRSTAGCRRSRCRRAAPTPSRATAPPPSSSRSPCRSRYPGAASGTPPRILEA